MSGSPTHEIGIVHYPGAQVACILGLTDFFGIASTIALDQRRSGLTALRVTHWKPIDSFDENLSFVYDSAPRGSPQPRTLIIPPTVEDPDPEVPAGVVSWVRNRHAAGAMLVSLCSGAFILAETGLVDGQSVATHQICAEAWRSVFRRSSSTQIGASLIMATSSRRANSYHGSTLACSSLTGFLVRP
jgi:transcriptional regulator GlxA family with amidase domain